MSCWPVFANPISPPASGESPEARSAIRFGEALLEVIPAGVYVCDAEGRIVRWNAKAEELWGCAPGEQGEAERFCGAAKLFWPDGQPVARHATPVVDVLKTGEPARDCEFILEQPSGTRISVTANVTAIRDDRGNIIGAINWFQVISAWKDAENQLRQSEAYLRAIVEATPECIKIVDPEGRLLQMNAAGLKMIEADSFAGVRMDEIVAPEHRQHWKQVHRAVCNGESTVFEYDLIGQRGTRRRMQSHAVPLQLPGGRTGQLSVTRDVTLQKQHEHMLRDNAARSRTLVDELNHRVKNTLANVRSLVHLTFSQGCSPDAVKKLDSRIQGLSIAHDLLTEGNWQGMSLCELINREMRPFLDERTCRIVVQGPDYFLPPRIALSLTMAIHELVTNAIKHGSLSHPTGHLHVSWTLGSESPNATTLEVRWREHGGPPAERPNKPGFGMRMLERGLPSETGASVSLDFKPEGLDALIRIPLPP